MTKETAWYNGDQKPVRVGVYKRKYPSNKYPYYSFWSGKKWSIREVSLFATSRNRGIASYFQDLPWCGLTKESK